MTSRYIKVSRSEILNKTGMYIRLIDCQVRICNPFIVFAIFRAKVNEHNREEQWFSQQGYFQYVCICFWVEKYVYFNC